MQADTSLPRSVRPCNEDGRSAEAPDCAMVPLLIETNSVILTDDIARLQSQLSASQDDNAQLTEDVEQLQRARWETQQQLDAERSEVERLKNENAAQEKQVLEVNADRRHVEESRAEALRNCEQALSDAATQAEARRAAEREAKVQRSRAKATEEELDHIRERLNRMIDQSNAQACHTELSTSAPPAHLYPTPSPPLVTSNII